MTAGQKAARRELIEERAKGTVKTRYLTYWLTRDSDVHGTLSTRVCVWLIRPMRRRYLGGLGAYWVCDDIQIPTAEGLASARYSSWSIQDCLLATRVIPDNDRECIRVGADPLDPEPESRSDDRTVGSSRERSVGLD